MATLQVTVEDNARALIADNVLWATAYAGGNKSINVYWDEAHGGYIQMGSWLSGGTHFVVKAMLRFPLTDPLIVGANINTAKLYFYAHTAEGKVLTMKVTQGFQSIPVVIADWNNNMAQTGILGSRAADITLPGWNSITLDVAGVNYILANIGGAAQFCIRSYQDYYNTSPVTVYSTFWNTYGTEHGSLEWYLELDYIGAGTKRVSGIRHIYRPGSYRAELTLGDVSMTSEVVREKVVLPPPYQKPYMDKLFEEQIRATIKPPYQAAYMEKLEREQREYEAGQTIEIPVTTTPELFRALEEDTKPQTREEKAAWAEQYVQAAGMAPSYPQTRGLWERITPWDERKGETFGGEVRERIDALAGWFKEGFGWLGSHLGGGWN